MIPNPAEPHPSDPTGGPASRRAAFDRRRRFAPSPALLLLRIAIMALALTIGVVLLSRGDLVLGILLVAFAALRLGMVLAMRRRRRQWHEARRGFGRP
jgi:hypothetical protein